MSFNYVDYCQYLLTSQTNYTLTHLEENLENLSHDTINRYLRNNDLKGDYEFHLSENDDRMDIRINILRDDREVFLSRIWGKALPLTSENLIRTLVQYPISAALAMPRITWQALILKYRKGLNPVLKPKPSSEMTIRTAPPSLIQRIERSLTSLKYKISRQFYGGKK
jgi:hypothetical protein